MIKVCSKELILWTQNIINNISDKESFYLFIDIFGGISKSELNLLAFSDKKEAFISQDLNKLQSKWTDYSNSDIPIQYFCRSCYWREYKFNVSNQVLIPRVETEQIVEIVSSIFNDSKKILFADLGTGSGNIAIALSILKSNWNGLATDINNNSIEIAKINHENLSNNNNLNFFVGNWWHPLRSFAGKIDVAISNPPYIPSEIYKKLPSKVKNFEPKIALYGGENGLMHLNQIISDAPKYLKKGGWIILENHFDQGEKVRNILQKYKFKSVDTINDVFGVGRFTIGKY